jgi:two-component system sensor histidine kinase/response regulator
LLKPIANSKQISLEFVAPKVYTVYVDSNSLSLIFRNLLSNAIKFTKANGKIVVSVDDAEEEGWVRISVSDNGIGMTEEALSRLFKPSQHFTTYGTGNEKGSGLGLLLVKDFVEYNNGTLTVSSEPDKGTTFSFKLPAASQD